MLRYLTQEGLAARPRLAKSMFRDRATQFASRHGWPVDVDGAGEERDDYDALTACYVVWERPDGTHGGSLRFLPTTGRTMAAEHFRDLTDGRVIRDPLIWECTRLCLAPGAPGRISAALLLGGAELGRHRGLGHMLGVFDAPMVRVYRRIGWGPIVLGSRGEGRERISAGLWAMNDAPLARLRRRAAISEEVSRAWVARSLGTAEPRRAD